MILLLARLFLPGVRRRARRRRFGGNRTVVPLQRGEPPPRVTVDDAVGRRELFRRDIALDGPRHDAFAERHFGLEKLAVEKCPRRGREPPSQAPQAVAEFGR